MKSWPKASRGQVIGLLGGSFDPAHEGHAHITLAAMKRFHLDHVWWLVSPGNPLKSHGPAPMSERILAARQMMRHPRVTVTDIEQRLGTRYTAETIAELKYRYPHARFVWLMGADNLVQFDQWQDWQSILEMVPVGVLARPGDRLAARVSKAARIYRSSRIIGRRSELIGNAAAPAWCLVNLPMNKASSTAIRAKGDWGK